ncbi:hypothetical protein Raf01_52320 [Rugosimonospora africana]|uniref:Uncharacterized protein n=1 Tax=Rugosimonospora africana TaxID=556532 RepID=A0A8J3QWF4_9ACTN|nr:hypothetical protein Raf01_52320 [Rugosimonospora africana]
MAQTQRGPGSTGASIAVGKTGDSVPPHAYDDAEFRDRLAAQLEAAGRRRRDARAVRAEFAARRDAGLKARHARKLRGHP